MIPQIAEFIEEQRRNWILMSSERIPKRVLKI
jgi:hypothetical protein